MSPMTTPIQEQTTVYTGGNHVKAANVNINYTYNVDQIDANEDKAPKDKLLAHVAPAALYDTAEVQEPAKCHPGTREAILRRLFGALDARSAENPFIWLHGAAGAGKSAISRTLCENLDAEHQLLASFFFFRASADRNTTARFIPTLAHQFRSVIPQLRTHIQQYIRKNPLIFTQSITTQAQHLLIDPILELHAQRELPSQQPTAIVIDGLDECENAPHRREVLEVLHKLKSELPFPITTLITSRPHRDIERVFKRPPFETETTEEPLNLEGDADADILKFYMDSFADIEKFHPLSAYLTRVDGVWPAPEIIKLLMDKTSGQFIFAKTVIRFVEPDTSNPDQRLQIILGALPPLHYRPFQQLDAIYKLVLSLIEPERIQDVLIALGIFLGNFCLSPYTTPALIFRDSWCISTPPRNTLVAEWIMGLGPGQAQQLLVGLESLLILRDGQLQIFHKSFTDFLFDQSRSERFYVAQDDIYELVLRSFINNHFYHPSIEPRALMYTNMEFLITHTQVTPELITAIGSIDFVQSDAVVRKSQPALEYPEDTWLRICDLFARCLLNSTIPNKEHIAARPIVSLKAVAMTRLQPYLQHPLLWPLLYMATRDDPPTKKAPTHECLTDLVISIPHHLLLEEQTNGFHFSYTRGETTIRMLHILYSNAGGPLLDVARAAVSQDESKDSYMVTLLLYLLDRIVEGTIEPSLLLSSDFLRRALRITEPHDLLLTTLDAFASTVKEQLDKATGTSLDRYNKRVLHNQRQIKFYARLWDPKDRIPLLHRLTDDWSELENIIASEQALHPTSDSPLPAYPMGAPLSPYVLYPIPIILVLGITLYRRGLFDR